MKALLPFLLISFWFVSGQTERSIVIPDSVITWTPTRLLSWSDFQGPKGLKNYGNAYTSYKIDIYPEDVLVDAHGRIQNADQLTVRANFYKRQSWTSVQDDQALLNHEQLHFDIAELFARKIRRRFNTLRHNNTLEFDAFWEAYKTLWQACRNYQKQYDEDTIHGMDLEKNRVWIQRVHEELKALDSY